jgi:uncharacterized protein GlcG (DUF336 family)
MGCGGCRRAGRRIPRSAGHKSKRKKRGEASRNGWAEAQRCKKLARPANQKEDAGMEALSTKDISLEQALLIVGKAIEKAKAIQTKMDIAVVDAGCNLKAFARMDGAWQGSIDIAIRKARTARFFDMPTGEIGKLSQPEGPLYNIEHSNGGLITFPGGVPIKTADGTIIGAVGVSGSTVENDHEVAQAGADAVA